MRLQSAMCRKEQTPPNGSSSVPCSAPAARHPIDNDSSRSHLQGKLGLTHHRDLCACSWLRGPAWLAVAVAFILLVELRSLVQPISRSSDVELTVLQAVEPAPREATAEPQGEGVDPKEGDLEEISLGSRPSQETSAQDSAWA